MYICWKERVFALLLIVPFVYMPFRTHAAPPPSPPTRYPHMPFRTHVCNTTNGRCRFRANASPLPPTPPQHPHTHLTPLSSLYAARFSSSTGLVRHQHVWTLSDSRFACLTHFPTSFSSSPTLFLPPSFSHPPPPPPSQLPSKHRRASKRGARLCVLPRWIIEEYEAMPYTGRCRGGLHTADRNGDAEGTTSKEALCGFPSPPLPPLPVPTPPPPPLAASSPVASLADLRHEKQ